MLYTKKITFKNLIIFSIVLGLLAIPLILMIFVNNGIISEIKGFITIPKLPTYRSTEISLKNILDNLDLFKVLLIDDDLPSDAIRPFGTIYNIGIILAIIGFINETYVLIKSIKNKKFNINMVMYFLFLSVTIVMMIIRIPSIYKANAMCLPLIFFDYSAIKLLSKKYKIVAYIILIYYIIAFGIFTYYYFTQYGVKYEYQVLFDNDMFKGLTQINTREELKDKKVIITTSSPAPHIYTLVSNPISPYDFNNTKTQDENYGKYTFNSTEIDEDSVYLVRDNFDLVWTLNTVCGFKLEQYGVYYLLYK